LQDGKGRVQLYVRITTGEEGSPNLSAGTSATLWAQRALYSAPAAGKSACMSVDTAFGEVVLPLPEKFHGLTDLEKR
jgi:hypothetical protein